ncbi:DUF4956 domain-containing protein [Luteolibacter sp. Populi]|uniref:DUF4956 domain-containing protein n=1 Tax=Luteolibacter sp. Populi TaxID=3230487 RepID=UPI003466FFAF
MIAFSFAEWFAAPAAKDLANTSLSVVVTLVLVLAIAYLHRYTARGAGHTQDYSHTLVIISIVTTVLIAVVSRRTGLGVAMFAAFSLIRFPASLGRSMDMAFVFFAIAVAMVSGSGHHLQAVGVTVIGCGVIYVLHRRNAFAPAHASHLLTVSLPSDADFQAVLSPVFAQHAASSSFLNSIPQAGSDRALIRYGLVLKPDTRLPHFIEALHGACGNERVLLVPADSAFDIER